jgi:hypothetical protein
MDEDKNEMELSAEYKLIAGKWMYDTFFDLINQEKDFRVEVRHDPESQKTRLKVIELSEDGQNQEGYDREKRLYKKLEKVMLEENCTLKETKNAVDRLREVYFNRKAGSLINSTRMSEIASHEVNSCNHKPIEVPQ